MQKTSLKWLSLRRWITNTLGAYLLKQEQEQFSKIVGNPFGDFFMLLGEPSFLACTTSCTIKTKVILDTNTIDSSSSLSIASRQDKLAVQCASVDVIYLSHCLELANDPHEVLREAHRVLAPEGTIIITGFNPISLWGIWRLLAQFSKAAPWQAKFIGINKSSDWLALLGFSQTAVARFMYVPPLNKSKILSKFAWLEKIGQRFQLPFSGAYMLVAKKRVLRLTPIPVPLPEKQEAILVNSLVETNIPPH